MATLVFECCSSNLLQTGSGKTYTMWGPPSAMVEGQSPSTQQGIAPRIFKMLFSEIERVCSSLSDFVKTFQRCLLHTVADP